MEKRVECNIYGRVQMVMFRDFTKRNAKKLNIAGFVENKSDGSVHVVAEGDEKKLKKLVEKMGEGPVFAKVNKIDTNWQNTTNEFNSFIIKY